MDTFHLLEAERHLEFHVGGSVGIVSQLVVVVETVVLSTKTECLMPCHATLLPFLKPSQFCARLHEELHLHLLKLPHAEDELTRHNLVAERLANLGNAERHLHASRLLHVQIVHEDALSRFRTQIDGACTLGSSTHLRLEHQVELTHVRPVASATDGANNAFVKDNLFQTFQVDAAFSVHHLLITLMQGVTLCLLLQYTGRSGTILSLVESITKTLAGLGYFLFNLLVILGNLILDEHIGAITLL